jgi:hypothetical protein
METPTFLPLEREWSAEQIEQAIYCVGCLRRRPESPRVQCAAQVNLGDYTPDARISCAAIVRVGGKMPQHGRMTLAERSCEQ